MLRNTFLHLERVGERGEKRLWQRGVRTWDDYLSKYSKSGNGRLAKNCGLLGECALALESRRALLRRVAQLFGWA